MMNLIAVLMAQASLESILSYSLIPIEGFAPELINSVLLLILASLTVGITQYVLSLRKNREIDPTLLPQVRALRTDLGTPQPALTTDLPHDAACPICMTPPTLPIETNCGHVFCINCFVLYWAHVGDFLPSRCPMCRSRVTILMLTQPVENYAADPDNLSKVEAYNRRHSGQPRTLIEQLYDTPVFLRHLFRAFFTPGMLHLTYLLRVVMILVGLLVYVVSPLDILPESVYGIFGMLDDLLVVFFLLCLLGNMYRAILVERAYGD